MGDDSYGVLGVLGLIGCVAAFFVLRRFFPSLTTVLLIIGGIILLLIVLLVVFVMYLAFRKSKGENEKASNQEVTTILSKGRVSLMEIRRIVVRLKSQQIKGVTEDICKEADKILKTLREQPEKIPQVRQFLNYYLPTLSSILTKYGRMEENSTLTAELSQSTLSCLGDIRTAMEKQYTNLFEDDVLDLTVEMEALTIACKRDGLLTDENLQLLENKKIFY